MLEQLRLIGLETGSEFQTDTGRVTLGLDMTRTNFPEYCGTQILYGHITKLPYVDGILKCIGYVAKTSQTYQDKEPVQINHTGPYLKFRYPIILSQEQTKNPRLAQLDLLVLLE